MKIHKNYAYKESAKIAQRENCQKLDSILCRFKIKRMPMAAQIDDETQDYDLVIAWKYKENFKVCKIIKNETDLSQDEIALVCSGGILPFGYETKDNYYKINGD